MTKFHHHNCAHVVEALFRSNILGRIAIFIGWFLYNIQIWQYRTAKRKRSNRERGLLTHFSSDMKRSKTSFDSGQTRCQQTKLTTTAQLVKLTRCHYTTYLFQNFQALTVIVYFFCPHKLRVYLDILSRCYQNEMNRTNISELLTSLDLEFCTLDTGVLKKIGNFICS